MPVSAPNEPLDAEQPAMVPLSRAAHALGLSRERTLRRLMAGQLDGKTIDGRWYITAASLSSALASDSDPRAAVRSIR